MSNLFGDLRLPDRFWNKCSPDESTGCWAWNASLTSEGYGQINMRANYGTRLAHRVAWIALVSQIPAGLVIDHRCRNRRCCNPEHLQVVTQQVNAAIGLTGLATGARNRAKTHCRKGHQYSGDNLYVHPTSKARVCRECVRASQRRTLERAR